MERVADVSEKNAKMHAAARGGERAGSGFDEDRASERVTRGWLYTAAEREAARKRNSDARRAEDVPIRTETGDERRDERRATSDERERRPREYGHRADVGERARGKRGDEKERRYAKKERRNDIERERKREAAREGENGRTRERRRALAWPAEGARRPHMCSETNVRSECRLLPIIRCRGVPLCARGWSADSVPRFYAARQPGPVRRARLSAKTAR